MPTDIVKALRDFAARDPLYTRYRRYYDGEHDTAIPSAKWRNAFGRLLREHVDNLCPAVVDAVADRLEVRGFEVERMGDLDFRTLRRRRGASVMDEEELREHREEMLGLVEDVWLRNRMDQQAGQLHQDALKCGDAYACVWPDESGFPLIYVWSPEGVTLRYDSDDPRRALWASKLWMTEEHFLRLNVYYPDRIEKYQTRRSAASGDWWPKDEKDFVRWLVPGESWPLANPYGRVPVFHFANNAALGRFGRSELRVMLSLQDGLNKAGADLMVNQEFLAFPQRYVTGLEVEIDDTTGKPKIPFEAGPDRVWSVASESVKFGEFAPTDPRGLLAIIADRRLEIGRVTGTPPHFFGDLTGNPPSGEALKTLEARLIKRIVDRQTSFGNVWADVVSFCLAVLGHRETMLTTRWVSAAPRSEKEHSEVLLNKRELGVSRQQALREFDYSDEQIERMEEENEQALLDGAGALASAEGRGAPPSAPTRSGAGSGAPTSQEQGGDDAAG